MFFKTPWVLIFIPFVLGLLIFVKNRQKPPSLRFSDTRLLSSLGPSWKIRFQSSLRFFRFLAVVLFLTALAGPRSVLEETIHKTEGIDIVLAIDASGSMAAEDFKIDTERLNRLEIVKKVVKDFIGGRKSDRLGLIAFGKYAYTVSPLTTDYAWLKENLERVALGIIPDGTAVGSAIASCVSRLKNSDAKSKIIILLTDGVNNAGKIDPLAAARIAQSYGIKIYTIGAGSKGPVPFPAFDLFGRKIYQTVLVDLDEGMLKKIAGTTGGQYFRATDTESLKKIYGQIDEMEKTKIEEQGYREYKELFDKFLYAALIFLLIEIILGKTVFLKIP